MTCLICGLRCSPGNASSIALTGLAVWFFDGLNGSGSHDQQWMGLWQVVDGKAMTAAAIPQSSQSSEALSEIIHTAILQ